MTLARRLRQRVRPGIRMRLLVANSVVVIAGIATTSVVAAIVGPPMFRRLMDEAVVPGLNGNHPYERAFRDATAMSVGIALGVSALAALTLSWYLSRRVHRSATALSRVASAVANGHYDIRVPPPHLGKEFDAVAGAFNKMAQQLGVVDDARRQMLADLAHEIRTPVSVLEAYMEALEDGVQPLDQDTISTLRDQTRRLARFSVDVNSLSVAERRTTAIDARWISPQALISTAIAAFAPRYKAKGVDLRSFVADGLPALWADPERLGQVLGNLLDNALRHTDPGGRVSVTAAVADEELAIAIKDTGVGVPPNTCPGCSTASIEPTRPATASTAEPASACRLLKRSSRLMTARSKPTATDTEPAAPSASPCPCETQLPAYPPTPAQASAVRPAPAPMADF